MIEYNKKNKEKNIKKQTNKKQTTDRFFERLYIKNVLVFNLNDQKKKKEKAKIK